MRVPKALTTPCVPAREVVARLAINPTTVLKAYRELEREGLVGARPGQGTFVRRTLAGGSPAVQARLRGDLDRWLRAAINSEGIVLSAATLFAFAWARPWWALRRIS
jgi:GntR family transcriptional regulator